MNVDLLVVMGGPIGVMDVDAYPWLSDEIRGLRMRLEQQRPTLGICLGAQLMAAALGATVYPGSHKEIGWAALELTVVQTLGVAAENPVSCLEGLPVLHWHGDKFDLPKAPNIKLLASTPLTPHQAFSVGSYGLALQFHPEVDHRQIEAWLVGHAVELQQAKVSISRLREDSAVFGPPAMKAGRRMLENWLRLGRAPLRPAC